MTTPSTGPNRALRWLFRAPAWLYRWHCGWVLSHRFLLLVHVGRRTGLRHQTVLEVMEYRKNGPELIVMSGWGRNANWLRNIEATPYPEVIIGSRQFIAMHRELDADEALRVVAAYEHRNRFAAPILRGVLTRLLGWRYDGSDNGRRRLVAQLPLIAFRPLA